MPTSFAFSSLDLHFWRKPSKRETNSEATATAGGRASSASAQPFHTVQRSVLNNGAPAPAHRTHSLQQESYFCCHHAACSCQLCKRRAAAEVYSRRSSSQQGRVDDDGGRNGREVRRFAVEDRRVDRPLIAEQPRTRSEWGHGSPTGNQNRYEHRQMHYRYRSETRIDPEEVEKREQLQQWLLQQPLSTRKLDQSDRHVAMLAGSMEEERSDSPLLRISQSRMSRRMTSTPTSTSTSYSFTYVAQEASMVSPLDWFSAHSRHVMKGKKCDSLEMARPLHLQNLCSLFQVLKLDTFIAF